MYNLRNNRNNNNYNINNENINNNSNINKIQQINTNQDKNIMEELNTNAIGNASVITPTRKCLRDSFQDSFVANACKTPRLADSPLKFVTIMDKRFNKLTEQIETIIQNKF